MPPANYITETHGIIIWFYNPSLKFNCFVWLYKALTEIQSFKSPSFFQECLFPRYHLGYIIMFHYQRDLSNCLDHTNCTIKAGLFGSIVHFLWQAVKNKWIKNPPVVSGHQPEKKKIFGKKDQCYINFLPWPFGKPLGIWFLNDWLWGRKGKLEKVSLSSVSVLFCELDLTN